MGSNPGEKLCRRRNRNDSVLNFEIDVATFLKSTSSFRHSTSERREIDVEYRKTYCFENHFEVDLDI